VSTDARGYLNSALVVESTYPSEFTVDSNLLQFSPKSQSPVLNVAYGRVWSVINQNVLPPIAISSDGSTIAYVYTYVPYLGDFYAMIDVYQNGKLVFQKEFDSETLGITASISTDNRYVGFLIGYNDGPDTVYVLDLKTNTIVLNKMVMIMTYEMFCFSPSGKYLVHGNLEINAWVRNDQTGKYVETSYFAFKESLTAENCEVNDAGLIALGTMNFETWNRTGAAVLAVQGNKIVQVWNWVGPEVNVPGVAVRHMVTSIAATNDFSAFAVGSWGSYDAKAPTLRVFNTKAGANGPIVDFVTGGSVLALDLSGSLSFGLSILSASVNFWIGMGTSKDMEQQGKLMLLTVNTTALKTVFD